MSSIPTDNRPPNHGPLIVNGTSRPITQPPIRFPPTPPNFAQHTWSSIATITTTANPTPLTIPYRPPSINNNNPRPTRRLFKPMDVVTPLGCKGDSTPTHEKLARGFSRNYKGDTTNLQNQSAKIPPFKSCSLHLTNIAPNTTVKHLLDALTLQGPFGRIYAVSITSGSLASGHATSAAKVALFTRDAAERLYDFIGKGRLVIAGYRVRVTWNRILVAEYPGPAYLSRTLVIEGDKDVVDIHRIGELLKRNLTFETQDVRVVEESGAQRKIEWVFGSYRAQAQVAKMALKSQWEGLSIRFGADPVDVGIAHGAMALCLRPDA